MNLSSMQLDTLKELINIGIGRAGSILSELVGSFVGLRVPNVGFCTVDTLENRLKTNSGEQMASVDQTFSGVLEGNAMLVFPRESGDSLTRQLVDDDSEISNLDFEREGVLSEVGNIVLNCVMGSLSNMLEGHFDFEVPVYREGQFSNLIVDPVPGEEIPKSEVPVLYANASFDIKEYSITGTILLLFELNSFDGLIEAVDHQIAQSV